MSKPPAARDLRIDFFRGLALIMIFIDHVPDNQFAKLTLANFGFSDAAELFVFLAGFSAVLAYAKSFDRKGFQAGAVRVGRRIFEIYYWHLAVLAASFVLLVLSARAFGDPAYLNNIGMWEFILTPATALAQALSLVHQPNMLNILPLYIALLAWFPVLYWLIRRSHLMALAVSFALWAAANLMMLNLPSTLEIRGWFFNPFAWQLLFTLGAVAADSIGVAHWRPPRWAVAAAVLYLLFALGMSSPWTAIPGLEDSRLISADLLGHVDKSYLSLWRVLHLLALVCLVGYLAGPQARWLHTSVARGISWSGRHSLEIFCLGTVLSFAGWIILKETDAGLGTQLAVILAGIGAMTWTAWYLERRKRARRRKSWSRRREAPDSSYG